MAAKVGIFAAILLVCAILLPSLASAFLEHDSRKTNVTINGDNNNDNVNVVHANDNDFELPISHDDTRKERSLKEKKKSKNKNKKNKKEKNSHEHEFPDFELDPTLIGGGQQVEGEYPHTWPGHNVPPFTEEHVQPEIFGGLREGFYQTTCPQAEEIIKNGLVRALPKDSTIAAAIPRLFLHDCFVKGCDASLLLDTTPSGEPIEKLAGQNGITVKGFELIDEIKAELEQNCPGIISCSDVLAYLTRDAFVALGLPHYEVSGGRRDSMESLEANVAGNLPQPDDTVDQMIDLFKKKGLNAEDLVVLIGAHSIGMAHCFNFLYRLDTPEKEKMVEPRLANVMRFACHNQMSKLAFDSTTQHTMDSTYYKQLLMNRALLEADQLLTQDIRTRGLIQQFSNDETLWLNKFGTAMNKLGAVEVLTGNQGQIRKQCGAVNL